MTAPTTTFCPQCGRPHPEGASFCPSCGAAVPTTDVVTYAARRIVRPRNPRMVAGVCSGLAIHYGWDVSAVRILFAVLVCVTFFTAILLYLAAWVILPDAPYALPPAVMQS